MLLTTILGYNPTMVVQLHCYPQNSDVRNPLVYPIFLEDRTYYKDVFEHNLFNGSTLQPIKDQDGHDTPILFVVGWLMGDEGSHSFNSSETATPIPGKAAR